MKPHPSHYDGAILKKFGGLPVKGFHFISFSFHFSFTVHNAVENVTKAKCDFDVLKACQNLFCHPSYLSDISMKKRRRIKARLAKWNKVRRRFVVEIFAAGAHHVESAGVGGIKVF